MPHSHANPQVFSARLYGKVLHDHDQVESPVAVIYTTINQMYNKQDFMDRTLQCVLLITLLIGHATGEQIQTRTRTNGATVAPIAKP